MSQRERAELEPWVRSPSMPAGLVMRVRVVLTAEDGAGTGALVCGWPTGRVSADSSSKRMPSQRRLRMPPRRHKTEWPLVDPNPLGAPHQSRTTVNRLLARVVRRPGAKGPDHEDVANTAVDRHHRGRRYAPAGLIEYLDAGGPVVPVAPARHQATPAPPPAEARTRPGPTSPRSGSLKPLLEE
jgi:hypothetical protein